MKLEWLLCSPFPARCKADGGLLICIDLHLLLACNFGTVNATTCHSLIGQFNKWRIATWHDLVEWSLSGKRGAI